MPLPSSINVIADAFAYQPLLGSADYITSAVVLLAQGQRDAFIWSKLAQSYATPILPAPPVIQSIHMDLTLYDLITKQAILANTTKDSPWPDRYKEALMNLEGIITGSMALVSGSGTVIARSSTAGAAGVTFVSGTDSFPVFSDGLPFEDSGVDQDKIDDARQLRWLVP